MVPADIKGMKIRPAHATIAALVTSLGGTNVQASAPEVRDVLERGRRRRGHLPVGLDLPVRHRQGRQIPYGSRALRTSFVWVMNKAKYDADVAGAEEGDRRPLHAEWAEKLAAPWADFEAAGRAKMKAEPGHEVYELTDAQLANGRRRPSRCANGGSWAADPMRRRRGGDPDNRS